VIERSFWELLSDPQSDLEPASTSSIFGVAYHVPAQYAAEVHAYLEYREKDGYSAHFTHFHPLSPPSDSNSKSTGQSGAPGAEVTTSPALSPLMCMVYIGLPTNAQFLVEPAQRDPASVAKVISVSRGKSGENRDYLYQLEDALEELGLGSADGHVTDLVRRVREIEAEKMAK
jgi:cation transport regulator ChaC